MKSGFFTNPPTWQPAAQGQDGGLGAVAAPQLIKHSADVVADGALRQILPGGDVGVGEGSGNQRQLFTSVEFG